MADFHVVSRKLFPFNGSDAKAIGGASLFVMTEGAEPCGVEIFTRKMVAALKLSDPQAGFELLPVTNRWRDLPVALRQVLQAKQIVFSLPVVAWKRMLAVPYLVLLASFLTGRRTVLFLHEWTSLHWLRRIVSVPFVVLSDSIVLLSPYVRGELERDRWISYAVRKCRLIPHPPTIRRPNERKVTDIVRHVEEAAKGFDVVIGYFGAIYKGKAPAALLDICDHLRGRGIRALIVFVGSFTKSLDDDEGQFRARVRDLALDNQIIITGYIETERELFALFERIGVFLFLFPEGLTARRSSVIACLQSGRPVVVSAPQSRDEFIHHPGLNALIESGALSFVSRSADAAEIADKVLAAAQQNVNTANLIDGDAWWKATTTATRAALDADPI